MNNDNNQNSGNNIDDILDILQRRKNQDLMNGNTKNDSPTRIDNEVVKNPRQSSFSLVSKDFTDVSQSNSQIGITPEKSSEFGSAEASVKATESPIKPEAKTQSEGIITNSLFDTKDEAVTTNNTEDDVKVVPSTKPISSETVTTRSSSLPPVKATSSVPAKPSGEIKSVPTPNPVRNDRTKQVPLNTPVSKAVSAANQSNQAQQGNSSQSPGIVRKDSPASSTPSSNANSRPALQQNKMIYPSAATPKPIPQPSGNNIRNTPSTSPVNSNANGTPAVSKNNVQQKNASNPPKPSGSISLSDFDDKEIEKANKRENKKKNKKKRGVPGWLKVIIYLVIVISVSVLISLTVIKVSNDIFAFVKSDKEITVEIKENATLDDVAKALKDAGIIEYPWIFTVYADSKIDKRAYLTRDFIPGEHVLKPSMNYDSILAALCISSYDKSTVRITIPEGYTFDEILNLFVENGVMNEEDRENYLTQLQEFPYEYEFITKLEQEGAFDNENRIHRLEGYLFPDTYDFYKNENPVAALDKLFLNFNSKFSDEMYRRAEALGMTVDQVITLASIIEEEGDSPANFAKISSVFHNRLNDKSGKFEFLGSDATTLYAYRIAGHDKKTLGPNETGFEHPYNTYTSIGLPPGPICNPGIEAIYAALYPDDTNYYYFLTMANGETVFAQTAAQHNANIAESNRLANEMN